MAQAENVIEAISAGNELMVEEDYDGAVVEFTRSLKLPVTTSTAQ